jgi:predicted RNA-binding protein Jag
MEREFLATGKTVEEAIEAAYEKAGVDREYVTVEIIERPRKKFLGLVSVPATAKAIIDEDYLTFRGQAGGLLVVTEMYDDEKDQLGFYVVNATDPLVDSEAKISIKFPGYNNVQIVEDGTTMNLALIDSTLKFDLGTGRGAFIMPY